MGEVKTVEVFISAEKFSELWNVMNDVAGVTPSDPKGGFSAIQVTVGDVVIKFWIKE